MSTRSLGEATVAGADNLVKLIASDDKQVRSLAWQGAGKVGAPAVGKLAALITHQNIEIGWAAKRALREIVRHAGRPGGVGFAEDDVIAELIPLLAKESPAAVKREVLWLLSEIGGDESVEPIVTLLADQEMREDARLVLDRIPGEKSLAALKAALETVPEDFKVNIAESLRHRGVAVAAYPSQKLVPKKQTNVKAGG